MAAAATDTALFLIAVPPHLASILLRCPEAGNLKSARLKPTTFSRRGQTQGRRAQRKDTDKAIKQAIQAARREFTAGPSGAAIIKGLGRVASTVAAANRAVDLVPPAVDPDKPAPNASFINPDSMDEDDALALMLLSVIQAAPFRRLDGAACSWMNVTGTGDARPWVQELARWRPGDMHQVHTCGLTRHARYICELPPIREWLEQDGTGGFYYINQA